jgi:hypothetical protein
MVLSLLLYLPYFNLAFHLDRAKRVSMSSAGEH